MTNPPDPPADKPYWSSGTLGALIDGGYSVFMYCEERDGWDRCGYSKQLDLEKLAARLGRDHGSMHDDLIPHHLY